MTKTLKIYGASDDLIEASGIEGADEFGRMPCPRCDTYVGAMLVIAGQERIRIHAIYSGSWSFAVAAENDDYDLFPAWPIRRTWGDSCVYSETLEIDVPDDARLTWAER